MIFTWGIFIQLKKIYNVLFEGIPLELKAGMKLLPLLNTEEE